MSPLPAHSVSPKGDDEVVSQRTFPNRGEVPEIVGVAPKDDSSAAGHMGEKAPMGTGDGDQVPFGPQPDTIPETYTAPESSKRPSPQEEVCRFRWWPLSNQRHRIICWKHCEALPLWMNTVSLWVR